MSDNVLQKIIDKKKLKLEKTKNEISLESINDQIEKNNNFIDFKNKIQNNICLLYTSPSPRDTA